MQERPVQKEYFGITVWENPLTDSMRDHECLCLNCDNLNPGSPNNCPIAQELSDACVRHNVALTLTRCPEFRLKNTH